MAEENSFGPVQVASPPLPPPPTLPEFSATPTPSRRPRRGLLFAVIVAAVAVLAGLVVWGAVAGFLPFGARRISAAEILGRALEALTTIQSGTMRVDMTFKTEPRSPDAKPITLDSTALQAKRQAVERDQQLLRDMTEIMTILQVPLPPPSSSLPIGVSPPRYPATPADLQTLTGVDSSAYAYQSDGQTFTLTFRLETAQAVAAWNRQLNEGRRLRQEATPFPTAAVGQDIVLTNGMEAPAVFLTGSTGLGELGLLGEDSSAMMYQSLPSDLEVNFNVRSDVMTLPSGELVPNFSTGLGGKVVAGGLTFAGDGEIRKVGDNFYGRINEFPSLGFFDLHAVKGQWVVMVPEDLVGSSWADSFVKAQEQSKESAELFRQHEQLFLQLLHRQQVVTVVQVLPLVTEDGQRLHHYRLALDRTKFAAFYRAFAEQAQAKFGSRSLVSQNPEVAAALENEEFTAMYDAIAPHLTLEMWVHAKTYLPRRFTASLRVVPPASVTKFADKQLMLALGMTLDRVNQPVQVDAPSPTISLDEATALITGQSAAEITLQRQIRQVEAVRSALRRYQRRAGQYPQTLADLQQRPSQVTTTSTPAPTPMPVAEQLWAGQDQNIDELPSNTDAPFLKVIPLDVYTRQPYEYQQEGTTYTLRYQVKLPAAAEQRGGLFTPTAREYREGKNTADPDTLSREAGASRDSGDRDGDGLSIEEELRYGTDPFAKDSDGDGYDDGVEVKNGFDPTSPVPGKKLEMFAPR